MLRVAAIEESIANQSQCQCSPVSVAAHDLVDPNLLRTQLEGKLYSASDGFAYDIARSLWNGALSIRPWAVVQPKSVADIQKCLLFPSENKVPFCPSFFFSVVSSSQNVFASPIPDLPLYKISFFFSYQHICLL